MGLRPGRTNGKKAYERARKNGEFEHVPAADRREANKKFRNHPTGLRCTICGEYAPKLQQVRRADGAVVPGCAACAKPRIPAFLDEPKQAVSQEWYAGWDLLNKSGYQPVVLALPAHVPVSRAEWREIRRQLARMVGPRPRYIPTGAIHGMEVIALGPGDYPSPYQPDAIQTWHERFITRIGEAIDLKVALINAPAETSGSDRHHMNWLADCKVQDAQHAAFVFATFAKAA